MWDEELTDNELEVLKHDPELKKVLKEQEEQQRRIVDRWMEMLAANKQLK